MWLIPLSCFDFIWFSHWTFDYLFISWLSFCLVLNKYIMISFDSCFTSFVPNLQWSIWWLCSLFPSKRSVLILFSIWQSGFCPFPTEHKNEEIHWVVKFTSLCSTCFSYHYILSLDIDTATVTFPNPSLLTHPLWDYNLKPHILWLCISQKYFSEFYHPLSLLNWISCNWHD